MDSSPGCEAGKVPLTEVLRFILRHPATRGGRLRALLRLVLWQTWKRVVRRPLFVRAFGSMALHLYPGDTSCSAVFYTGLPDYEEMSFARDVLRPDDTFVDVGANAGVYTLLAASVMGREGKIIAIEPGPEARWTLLEHIAANRLSGTRVIASAVGRRPGWVRMSVDEGTRNHVVEVIDPSPAAPGPDWTLLQTLDEVCGGKDPFLAKVDVEGFELEVLEGAVGLVAARRPAAWILETNKLGNRYDAPLERLERWLLERGGEICVYEPRTRELRSVRLTGNDVPLNVIAVFDREAVVARLHGG